MAVATRLDTMIRKQAVIEKTRRHVLVWVAVAAAVVGVAVVAIGILLQTAFFHHKVLSQKQATLQTIKANSGAAAKLQSDITLLNTNPDLKKVRASDNAPAVQTILDALPADGNRLALGASLQKKLLNIPGVTVDALSVEPNGGDGQASDAQPSAGELHTIGFSASISGTPEVVRQALRRLESSVRAINIEKLYGVASGNAVTVQVSGVTYYYPPAQLQITTKTLKERL